MPTSCHVEQGYLQSYIAEVDFQLQIGSVRTIRLWRMSRHDKHLLLPEGLRQGLHGIIKYQNVALLEHNVVD